MVARSGKRDPFSVTAKVAVTVAESLAATVSVSVAAVRCLGR
jgi:hypothetical protein